jgi:hypothetical protein
VLSGVCSGAIFDVIFEEAASDGSKLVQILRLLLIGNYSCGEIREFKLLFISGVTFR